MQFLFNGICYGRISHVIFLVTEITVYYLFKIAKAKSHTAAWGEAIGEHIGRERLPSVGLTENTNNTRKLLCVTINGWVEKKTGVLWQNSSDGDRLAYGMASHARSIIEHWWNGNSQILHGKSLRQIWIWNVSVTKVHTPYGESYNPIVTHHIFLVVVCVCFVRLANALQNAINQYRIELQQ